MHSIGVYCKQEHSATIGKLRYDYIQHSEYNKKSVIRRFSLTDRLRASR